MSIAEHTTWSGCYDDSWRDEITPDSFSHPAKMARGLVRRIFDELSLPRGGVVVVTAEVLEQIKIDLAGGGGVDVVVGSPPYSGIRQDGGRIAKEGVGGFGAYTNEPADFWHTQRDQRNLGNLPSGKVEDILDTTKESQ